MEIPYSEGKQHQPQSRVRTKLLYAYAPKYHTQKNTVLSSQKNIFDNVKICEPLGCNDHNQIYFIIKVKGSRNLKIQHRKYFHKGRCKDLREYLAKIDWNNTLKNKTAIVCWYILESSSIHLSP